MPATLEISPGLLKQLPGEFSHGRAQFRVSREFIASVASDNFRLWMRAPVGQLTDLGSVPRPFWRTVSPSQYTTAFVLHDNQCEEQPVPSYVAAAIMRWMMEAGGAPGWQSRLAGAGVTYFGPQFSGPSPTFTEDSE